MSSIIVANRAWIMMREREESGNDKSRRNDVTHGQWVAMGVTTSQGPFLVSVAPRRWRCQALCDSSRTAVYFCPRCIRKSSWP